MAQSKAGPAIRLRRPRAGRWGGGTDQAAAGGRAVRIGNDLAKMHFLLKNVDLGHFCISGPSRPQKWIRLEISVQKMVE